MSSSKVTNDSYSTKFNTNRLLYEAEALNSKVNQYRKTFALGLSSPKTEPFNNSMCRTGAAFNPKCNINTLNSVSNTFASMAKIPELDEKGGQAQNKLCNLKKSYENHINDLYSNFKACLNKLEELYSTFATTNKTDVPLIKQIINDNLFYERENQIANFIEEITELKATNLSPAQSNEMIQAQIENVKQGYERELQKKTNESQMIINKMKKEVMDNNGNINQFQEEMALIKEENEETKNELDRLQKVISVLEIDLNSSDNQLKEKSAKYETLQKDFANLQTQYFEASLKLKKYNEDNSTMKGMVDHYEKERKEMLEKYSSFHSDRETTQNDLILSFEKGQKMKYESYNTTIAQLKDANNKLEEELKNEKEKAYANKQNYNKLYEEMQDKVKLLSTEWEKKLKMEQKDYENIIAEIEYKQKTQIDNIMHEHDNELECKNREIDKLKQSAELLKKFEKEYIRINDHEDKINEEICDFRKKFDIEFNNKRQALETEYQIKLNQVENDKKIEYEFLTENIKTNLRRVEKENIDLKSEIMQQESRIEKEKEKYMQAHKEINILNSTLLEKQKEFINLSDKNTLNIESLLKKDNELISKKKEIEELTAKNTKLIELENAKANERTANLNLKNEIQNLILINRELENKVKSQVDTTTSLSNQLSLSNIARQKLSTSLTQLKNDLKSLKQFYLQMMQNTKTEVWMLIEGFNTKIQNYDTIKRNQMKEIEKKFEKHFTEQFRQNDKLLKENKTLTNSRQEASLKSNDLQYKVFELENELKNCKSLVTKHKDDIITKDAEIERLTSITQDSSKKIKNVIAELGLKLTKLKKKYQSELLILRSDIENLKQIHNTEVTTLAAKNQSTSLQNLIKTLKNETTQKSHSIQKLKTQNQALNIDLENKGEELANTKKEYDKLITLKDKKIKDLQSIVNQSFSTYNSGVNSIKIAKKLNDDVRSLIQKVKGQENYSAINSNNI